MGDMSVYMYSIYAVDESKTMLVKSKQSQLMIDRQYFVIILQYKPIND